MKKETILVVDFGTSKVHANLIDISNGSTIVGKSASFKWIHPADSWTEIDPDEIWGVSQKTVSEVLQEIDGSTKIHGISFSYMGDNLVPVDGKCNPVYNLIPAFDCRSDDEVEEFFEKIGEKNYTEITGSPILPMNVGTKILWMKNNLKDVFEKTKYFFSLQQLINHKLGLGPVNDYTMASRKVLYNIKNWKWAKSILDVIGISENSLGNLVTESTSVIGKIRKYGVVKLPYEIPVILGAHDCGCGLIGLGIDFEENGILGNITGTFDHVGYLTRDFINIFKKPNLSTYCGPLKDSYATVGFIIAGSNLEWFIKELYPQKEKGIFKKLDDMVNFDGGSKLFFIPGLENSKGCLIGLDLSHGLTDIYRAIIEGVTYSLKSVVDNIEAKLGSRFNCVRAGGGSAQSDKWLQLKADLFNKRVERVKNLEISSVGAAIMASVSLGIYKNFKEAISKMVLIDKVFEPAKITSERNMERYNDFKNLRYS